MTTPLGSTVVAAAADGSQLIQIDNGDRFVIPVIRDLSRDPPLYEYAQSQYVSLQAQDNSNDQTLAAIQVKTSLSCNVGNWHY